MPAQLSFPCPRTWMARINRLNGPTAKSAPTPHGRMHHKHQHAKYQALLPSPRLKGTTPPPRAHLRYGWAGSDGRSYCAVPSTPRNPHLCVLCCSISTILPFNLRYLTSRHLQRLPKSYFARVEPIPPTSLGTFQLVTLRSSSTEEAIVSNIPVYLHPTPLLPSVDL